MSAEYFPDVANCLHFTFITSYRLLLFYCFCFHFHVIIFTSKVKLFFCVCVVIVCYSKFVHFCLFQGGTSKYVSKVSYVRAFL